MLALERLNCGPQNWWKCVLVSSIIGSNVISHPQMVPQDEINSYGGCPIGTHNTMGLVGLNSRSIKVPCEEKTQQVFTHFCHLCYSHPPARDIHCDINGSTVFKTILSSVVVPSVLGCGCLVFFCALLERPSRWRWSVLGPVHSCHLLTPANSYL